MSHRSNYVSRDGHKFHTHIVVISALSSSRRPPPRGPKSDAWVIIDITKLKFDTTNATTSLRSHGVTYRPVSYVSSKKNIYIYMPICQAPPPGYQKSSFAKHHHHHHHEKSHTRATKPQNKTEQDVIGYTDDCKIIIKSNQSKAQS